ncbi:hypothetical protein OF83DRAFT_1279195 [Amylostereum chailletii]|nr:hypothetical protein OF83DRAFT_1279195 [Amylostereum chailletii]
MPRKKQTGVEAESSSEPVAGPSLSALPPAMTTTMQTRRRILPARSRRGGAGVGNSDADIMILETIKRKRAFNILRTMLCLLTFSWAGTYVDESDPLIPTSTRFLLATSPAHVPESSTGVPLKLAINTVAYDRYFDKPEVLKAYREQSIIQTPDFTPLDEHAAVGGRFRARASEEDGADTSDAAYEKRHRKYETFEKRQRLREKEKLTYEHYKLKERIDQLRSMDPSAFMVVPASTFNDTAPTQIPSSVPSIDGLDSPALLEGERRKEQMLEVAESLEGRYRLLLNPDPDPKRTQEGTPRHQSTSTSALSKPPQALKSSQKPGVLQMRGRESDEGTEEDADEKEEEQEVTIDEDGDEDDEDDEDEDGEDEDEDEEEDELADDSDIVAVPAKTTKKSKLYPPVQESLKLRIKWSGATTKSAATKSIARKRPRLSAPIPSPLVLDLDDQSASAPFLGPRPRNANGTYMPGPRLPMTPEQSATPFPRKRRRLTSVDTVAPVFDPDAWKKSDLYIHAQRSMNAFKPPRGTNAFGVKVPEMPENLEFEIPAWAVPDSLRLQNEQGDPEDSSVTCAKSDVAVDDVVVVDGEIMDEKVA